MPDVRLVMMSALALALMAAMARPQHRLHVDLAPSTIDWLEAPPALTCPSDRPEDCAILWGP
jgi:hypothetical protein